MAVGSNHLNSKGDDRILKLTYVLTLGNITQEWQRGRKLAIYTHHPIYVHHPSLCTLSAVFLLHIADFALEDPYATNALPLIASALKYAAISRSFDCCDRATSPMTRLFLPIEYTRPLSLSVSPDHLRPPVIASITTSLIRLDQQRSKAVDF
jgi:hypothetical protein